MVPVKDAKFPSVVSFSSGAHGKSCMGDYLFWTCLFERPVKKRYKTWGRARPVLPPGDRFDRMRIEMREAKDPEDRKIYRRIYEELMGSGANIKYIRPSTYEEIRRWFLTHESDAKHAYRILIGGKEMKVWKGLWSQSD